MSVATSLFLIGLSVFTAQEAFGYIDPGAGSLLLQLIMGGIAGLLVFGRTLWSRLFRKGGGTQTSKSADSDSPTKQ